MGVCVGVPVPSRAPKRKLIWYHVYVIIPFPCGVVDRIWACVLGVPVPSRAPKRKLIWYHVYVIIPFPCGFVDRIWACVL